MPRLRVLFGEQVQDTHVMQGDEAAVGRARECQVVIDNLGVSRRHCRILKNGEAYVLEDLGSQNGTFVNGERVAKKDLKHGDRIGIGKHVVLFEETWEGMEQASPELPGGLKKPKGFMGDVEHTMAVETFRTKKFQAAAGTPASAAAGPGAPAPAPEGRRCYLWDSKTGKTFDLVKPETSLGKGRAADVALRGLFIAPLHATIRKASDGYYINHLAGWRGVRVNGRKIRDARLENRDLVEIGSYELQFIVHEAGEKPTD